MNNKTLIEKIIENKAIDKNYFVSASAGTGKTYTITHYYLEILKNNLDNSNIVDAILAVTFTKKAAGEMKERITQMVEEKVKEDKENQNMWKQIKTNLSRAVITTIDSFCSDLIKENIIYSDLDNSFTIMNNLEKEIFLEKSLNTTMNCIYLLYENKEIKLKGINEKRKEIIKKYIKQIKSINNYSHGLKEVIKENKLESNLKIILEKYRYEIFNTESYDYNYSEEETQSKIDKTKILKYIAKILIEIYRNNTIDNNIVGFFELKRIAYELIKTNDKVRERYQNKYKYIIIDEFQDTDELQRNIFNNLHTKDNYMFYVGDKKQSIYRFRGADVSVFSKSITEFESNGNKVENLTTNFRSFNEIIEYSNYLSKEKLFNFNDIKNADKNLLKNMSFSNDEISFHNQKSKISENKQNENIPKLTENDSHRIKLVKTEEIADRRKNCSSEEIQATVKIIKKLMNQKIYNKNGELKDIQFKDIALLLKQIKGYEEEIKKHFEEAKINYYIVGSKMFYKRPEIKALISLLKIIDNPNSDYDFLSSLFSIFFVIKLDEIEEVLKSYINQEDSLFKTFNKFKNELNNYKTEIEAIKKYSKLKVSLKPSVILEKLLENTNFYNKLQLLENYESAYANVQKFITQIKEYEENITDISEIIEMLNKSTEVYEEEVSIDSYEDNTVKIMSVHQSKGLEFPIVIFGGLGKKEEIKEEIYIDNINNKNIFGLKQYLTDEEKEEFSNFNLLEVSEKRRLIYVAITRPSQLLITLIPKYKKAANNTYYCDYLEKCDYEKVDIIDQNEIKDIQLQIPKNINQIEKEKYDKNFSDLTSCEYRNYISPSYLKQTEYDTEKEEKQTIEINYDIEFENTIQQTIDEGIRLHNELEKVNNFEELTTLISKEKNLADLNNLEIVKKMFDSETSIAEAELKKSITINNKEYILTGIVDRLIINNNEIEVIDYKYSDLKNDEQIEAYKFQIQYYLWLLKDYGTLKKGYILKIKNNPKLIEVDPDDNFEEKLKTAIINMEGKKWK